MDRVQNYFLASVKPTEGSVSNIGTKTVNTPDWLTRRNGTLTLGSDRHTWFVQFAGQPNYSLRVVPVGNAFGCAVRQTINGVRIECPASYPTKEQAIAAGLEELRKAMGWD